MHNRTGKCQICGVEKPVAKLMPAVSVRDSLVNIIKESNPNWDSSGYICLDDLNKFRGTFVQKILEEENGTLSAYDKEVLDSIIEKDILSKNINDEAVKNLTFGEKLSDKLAQFGGSWPFIIIFGSFLLVWMLINLFLLTVHPFDPYPFILLNLVLSCLAAIQAPVIMMSQNRQENKDRLRARNDYQVNLKAEIEIRQLNDKVDHLMLQLGQKLLEIQQIQIDLMEDISHKIDKK